MKSLFTILCFLSFAFCTSHLQAQYIYTFAGNGTGAATGTGGYTGDGGLANAAELNACTGVAFDGAGNVYIADMLNNVVRKVNTMGIISTFAGTGTAGYSGDKGAASLAKLNRPYGVAADAAGNVYIADYNNNVIRKVNTSGTITTFAGSGIAGYSGDGGAATAAKLQHPTGLALDTLGNLFIADAANNAVREVYLSGTIITRAGNGVSGYSGDGGLAVNAKLSYPVSVAVDPYDQVYIADYNNNVVRKIDTLGNISTFAGNSTAGHGGDGHAANTAQLHFPSGVSVYGFGNVYISDEGNNTVRVVNSAGIISTYAGIYANGYSGDGGFANAAELSSPKGIAADGQNRLYIADYDNNVIRVVRTSTGVGSAGSQQEAFQIYPNPAHGSFTVELLGTGEIRTITVTDVLGRIVSTGNAAASHTKQAINVNNIPAGTYIVNITSGENTSHKQVQVW